MCLNCVTRVYDSGEDSHGGRRLGGFLKASECWDKKSGEALRDVRSALSCACVRSFDRAEQVWTVQEHLSYGGWSVHLDRYIYL